MTAKGINCIACWSPDQPNRLESEALPVFRQPLYRTKETLEVRFEELDFAGFAQILEKLAGQMDIYLQSWKTFLINEAPLKFSPEETEACKKDKDDLLMKLSDTVLV